MYTCIAQATTHVKSVLINSNYGRAQFLALADARDFEHWVTRIARKDNEKRKVLWP